MASHAFSLIKIMMWAALLDFFFQTVVCLCGWSSHEIMASQGILVSVRETRCKGLGKV